MVGFGLFERYCFTSPPAPLLLRGTGGEVVQAINYLISFVFRFHENILRIGVLH